MNQSHFAAWNCTRCEGGAAGGAVQPRALDSAVSRMWRIVFRVEGVHVLDVDLTDYHSEGIMSREQGQRFVRRLAAAPPIASRTAHLSRLHGGSAGGTQLDGERGGA